MDVDRSVGPVGESPDAALGRIGGALADAVTAAVPGWVERSVTDLVLAWSGTVSPDAAAAARRAGAVSAEEVGPELRRLLSSDVDGQWTNPMTIIRRAVGHATDALQETGVGAVERSREDESRFPDDIYGLTPHTFADLDPSLHELGIIWGAVKASAHLARHRPPASS